MKYILVLTLVLFTFGCTSTNVPTPIEVDLSNTSTDGTYGFSQDNPIKLGGFLRGTKYEGAHIQYFDGLTGPNGEEIQIRRLGSCCGFLDASLPLGGGLLDMYQLSYEGIEQPVVVYVNLYKYEQPKAPIGFALL